LKASLLLGVAVALAFAALAYAQETKPEAPAPPPPPTTPSERIVGARIVGASAVSPDAVLYYLGVKVGDPYDPAKIKKNFESLWRSGLFDEIQIDAERGPEGVTLIFTVTDRPKISAVDYTGNKKLSVSQIKDKLTQVKATIKIGVPLSLKDVAAVEQGIRDVYTENGFRSVSVEYRLEGENRTEKKLVFVIDEGEKIKIESIGFKGNTVFAATTLRNSMKKTKIDTLWRIFSDKTVYNQANFDEDMESLKHFYQDHGYKDIVVKDPTLDVFVSNPKQKDTKKIKRKMRITIPLVEGEKFYFGTIDLATDEGAPKVFPKAKLLKSFRYCSQGSTLSRDRLNEALSEIETEYRTKGYIYFFADPQYQKASKDRRVDIIVKMFEGDQFTLGRLEFTGNTSTKDKVLRREITIDEGQVLDMEAFKKSVLKINQLGYFKLGEDPSFSPDNQNKTVDIVIKGQEASRNELNFGAGYSAQDGFFAQFSFGTRNFLGRGELLNASAQVGKVSKFYNLSYTVPWFMDKNQTVGGSIYNRATDYQGIEDRRKGFTLFYGKAIGIFDSFGLGYGLQNISAFYPVQPAPIPPGYPIPPPATSRVAGTTSSITPSYTYDSTNDPFNPTAGYRFGGALQYAGLGGTDYFLKPTLAVTTYLPFLRHRYIGLHLEAGWVVPLRDHPLPIFERYSIGGEQSIRGYAIGSIIPLHKNNQVFVDSEGRILGGNRFFVLNAEYTFLTLGPVNLLTFIDAGNTWIEDQPTSFANLFASTGIEMRFFLPIFQAPLRFIYAWNLKVVQPLDQYGFPISQYKEKPHQFLFSIGTAF
jgi:outer membrane protein insertion porin family